jgi:hypothetical protein
LVHPSRATWLTGLRFSPDGKRFIAGDYPGGVVVLWDVATGKQLQAIETGYGYRGSAEYLFLTPDWTTLFVSRSKRKYTRVEQDGKHLLRWEFDGAVRSWDLASGQPRRTYQHQPPHNVLGMRLSPDGTRFITFEEIPGVYEGAPKRGARLWDVATGRPRPLPDGLRSDGRFSPDSRTLAISTEDKDGYATALKQFDAATGKEKWSVPVKDKNVWTGVATFSPDGRLAVGSYEVFPARRAWNKSRGWLKWWDADDGREVASFAGENNELFGLPLFSPDGRTLAVTEWRRTATGNSAENARLFLYDVATKQRTRIVNLGRKKAGERLIAGRPAFSPDGKWLAVGTLTVPDTRNRDLDVHDLPQPRIHLIDVAAGEIRETLVAPQSFGRDACFSPDGRTLATSGHGRVLLWDLTGLAGATARADQR